MTYPKNTAAKFINKALGEIGTVEEGDNETKYGESMKANGLPWCGSFVNWCAKQSGVGIHSVVSTAAGAELFKKINRWSNIPRLGSIAFMDFPHDGVDRISHVGIVVGLLPNKQVQTVEGNTSGSGDQRNGGMVMLKVRSYAEGKEIIGFGLPKFEEYDGEFPKIPTSTDKPTKGKK